MGGRRRGRHHRGGRRSRMPKITKQHIRGTNFVADRTIVRFRQQFDFNVKQAMAGFGTLNQIPGNSLESVTSPALAQWALAYGSFRVLKSHLKCVFTNVEATYSKTVGITQLPVGIATGPTPTATVYLSEQPRSKFRYLTPLSGSKSLGRVQAHGSTATAFGDHTASTSANDIQVTGAYATPPGDAWSWSVWTQNVTGAGVLETAGTNIQAVVTYTVEFLLRKVPTT